MRALGGTTCLLVLAGALAGGACDWRKFDDLKNGTPVLAIGPPSGYPGGDSFGQILLPLDPPADKSAAGRFIVTAATITAVGVMSFDASGHVSGAGVQNDALGKLAMGPVSAIAAIPGGKQVLLGAPGPISGDALVMNVDEPYQTTTFQELGESEYGNGVAVGNVSGGAAPEFVVLSSDTLHVYADVVLPGIGTEHTRVWSGAADPCPLQFTTALLPRDRANRPVLIARVLASGMQIVVGTPTGAGAGYVSIFEFDATAGITCWAALTASQPRFGQAMTLVDLLGSDGLPGGDGMPDHLLVGAPPTHAYLYKLPLTNNQPPAMMVMEAMTATDFGGAVAAFDIDGKAGDEMFVGNPDATVDGTTTAGRVSIYTTPTMTLLATTIPNPLAMHEPKAGVGYGSGVASVRFCPGSVAQPGGDGGVADGGASGGACTRLPIIGSTSNVYAYFTLGQTDPRAK